MHTVAERAGVSVMTVSRVLKNHPRVAPATRERVLQASAELNYRPNPLLTALVEQRRRRRNPDQGTVLAYVMDQDYAIENAGHTHALFSGARDQARKLGFELEVFSVGRTTAEERRLDAILYNRGIPGLILAPMPLNITSRYYAFTWEHYAAVALDYGFDGIAVNPVLSDHYSAMLRVMRECAKRGIRRVGLLMRSVFHQRVEHRVLAAYLSESGPDRLPHLILDAWDESAFSRWFDACAPEVIVTSMTYLHPMSAVLQSRGLRIPEDVGLINLNTSATTTLPTDPSKVLTGTNPMGQQMGAAAINRVTAQLFRNERGVPLVQSVTLIPPQWVEGGTLASVQTT